MEKIIFGKNIDFGTATSSYQIEGACSADGKGESIWDRFCLREGNIADNSSGETACDHYHRYREDVQIMKSLGISCYRFSIAWSRILPNGTGEVNKAGLTFYHELCDELIRNGIEPVITLYHWDLPQALQNRGGFMNRECIKWFLEYAKLIFTEFKDKVKYFITFNEPHAFIFSGYVTGAHAPGYRDLKTGLEAAHNVLLCHGEAVKIFREINSSGRIGICCDMTPHIALNSRDEKYARLFENKESNWFVDAVLKGEYPQDAVEYYRKLRVMPAISNSDLETISPKCDFFAVNYYRCEGITNVGTDEQPIIKPVTFGGDITDIGWEITPHGIYDSIMYVDSLQPGIEIIISENGRSCRDIINVDGEVKDYDRVDYYYRHLAECKRAQDDGANLTKYFAWSLFDNFEWACGYTQRFGLVYVDFHTQKRIIKESGKYYASVIKDNLGIQRKKYWRGDTSWSNS